MKIKVKNIKSGVVEFHTEKKAKFLSRFKNIEVFWPKKDKSKKAEKIEEVTLKSEEVVESISKKTEKTTRKSASDK